MAKGRESRLSDLRNVHSKEEVVECQERKVVVKLEECVVLRRK